jgi:transcription antitermination factor NusG
MDEISYASWCASRWYAVYCAPSKERQAAHALADILELPVYLPELIRHFRGRDQRAVFFPRYIFVRVNLHEVPLNRLNMMPGVQELVRFGGIPQPIPANVVEAIRQQLEHWNAEGGLPLHDFEPGESVRFKEGPLRDLDAIFVGSTKSRDRVHVLMEFLGQQRDIELGVEMLLGTHVGSAIRRSRRTRGKGRHIQQS